jgi:8-oxo-dGTP diphosphatase
MVSRRLLHPLVTADVALFGLDEHDVLRVLLVRRAEEPEAGRWALPGSVLDPERDADIEATARRTFADKLRLELPHVEQVHVASGARRDPRGWSLSVVFAALVRCDQVEAQAALRIDGVDWVDPDSVARRRLAFDHVSHVHHALAALREKVARRALPLHLLPERFTLSHLQRACEAVLGEPLDKSAFRRRLKGSTELEPTDEWERGPQRPAQLFRAAKGFAFRAPPGQRGGEGD